MPKNTKDLTLDSLLLNVFVYGESGTHKTYFAASFPKPYFFDFDNGMLTVRGQDVAYDTYVDQPGESPHAFQDFIKQMKSFYNLKKEGKLPYETIVLDSLTTFQECVMRDVKYNNHTEAKPMTLPEWGMLISQLRKHIYEVTALGTHIVVTAHAQTVKDDLTCAIKTQPLLYGKDLPGQVPLWFDEAYYAEVKKGKVGTEFEMKTVGDSRKTAKSRLGLSAIETDLTYAKIMAKVKGGKDAVHSTGKA